MTATPLIRPLLNAVAPRFTVGDLGDTLAFYGQLGFALTDQWGEGFTIIARDGIALHLNVSDGHSVCWIRVTNIEALYQEYLPTGAIQSRLASQPWGMKEFYICDPFRKLILFGKRVLKRRQVPNQRGEQQESSRERVEAISSPS